jgi:hypothetical protein
LASPFEFPTEVADRAVRRRAVSHLKKAGVRLPRFEELAEPEKAPRSIRGALAGVHPDAAHPANLYRVNWLNDMARTGQNAVPAFVELPETLTGVKARIVLALGALFPMIRAHKVLAAYGCLAPRLVSGRFDPARQRAIWPSTGNYCRGGVAISRILGCRTNVRAPDEVEGDLYAMTSCNDVGGARLLEFMREFDLDRIEPLADAIITRSEGAMRQATSAIPDRVARKSVG